MTDWSPPSTPRGQISHVPPMPGLDGMRALAVVAVMVYHANHTWLYGGFLGVEVFFVISGYLITLLLISEHERSGRIHLRQFWLRRFRRLLPALFVMLGLLTIYLAVVYSEARGRVRGDIVAGVGYVSNWYQIVVGAGYTATEAFVPLRHLWSLAVEEQFYVVWPLVMALILRGGRHRLPRVALWLFGVSVAISIAVALLYVPGDIDSVCTAESSHGYWRVAGRCISINDALYLGTISRAGGLMLGASLAMVWRPMALLRGPMRSKHRVLDIIGLAGLGLLVFMAWRIHLADPALTMLTGSRFDPWLFRGGLFVVGLGTVMMIAAVSHRMSMLGRFLGMRPLRWIGTRSYGLYLYHWPIYQIIRKEAGRALSWWEFLLALAIAVPITEASYRIVETPIRQGRIGAWLRGELRRPTSEVLRRRRRTAVAGLCSVTMLGFAGVSVAMAPNDCVGTVECASEAGSALVATQTTIAAPTAVADVSTTTAPSVPSVPSGSLDPSGHAGVTTTPSTAAPTTEAPVVRPPIAVGESVMLGAVPQLQAGGFTVYAEVSKQGGWVAQVVGQLRAGGQVGDTIVIQTGTNGPVEQATYDEIMSYLPPEAVPKVVFLTVHADRGWIAGNNELIHGLQGRYPNVIVLEWDAFVTQGLVPGMAGDGIHLGTNAAKQTYANYIFDVIGRRDLVQPVLVE